jgi:hypothetical protein
MNIVNRIQHPDTHKDEALALSRLSLIDKQHAKRTSQKGLLLCNDMSIDSEVIYWKRIPGDIEFESHLSPHHDEHDNKFLTFSLDHAGE